MFCGVSDDNWWSIISFSSRKASSFFFSLSLAPKYGFDLCLLNLSLWWVSVCGGLRLTLSWSPSGLSSIPIESMSTLHGMSAMPSALLTHVKLHVFSHFQCSKPGLFCFFGTFSSCDFVVKVRAGMWVNWLLIVLYFLDYDGLQLWILWQFT